MSLINYLTYQSPQRRLREYERGLSDLYMDALLLGRYKEARAIWERRERVRRAAHRENEPIAPPHSGENHLELYEIHEAS